jgi:hypothetical protein
MAEGARHVPSNGAVKNDALYARACRGEVGVRAVGPIVAHLVVGVSVREGVCGGRGGGGGGGAGGAEPHLHRSRGPSDVVPLHVTVLGHILDAKGLTIHEQLHLVGVRVRPHAEDGARSPAAGGSTTHQRRGRVHC